MLRPANRRSTNAWPATPSAKAPRTRSAPSSTALNGRKSGTAPDYNYSDANKNSGITWDEATFKEYIKDPKAKIPGTKMAFAGIKNENEINNLWSFVAQFDKDGKIKQ
ncbi:cytochrome c2 [Bradyrhizobium sp. i1.4.4]